MGTDICADDFEHRQLDGLAAARKRPQLVSEINVSQPAVSVGSATTGAMTTASGHLLGYARVSTARP
jgi:hypothetical protein